MRAVSASPTPSAWTADDARVVTRLMLLAVAWRVATALFAYLANAQLPLAQPEQFTVLNDTHVFWDTFARNDSGWYLGIASRGYLWVDGGRNNLAFFPAYPLLMGLAGRMFGGGQADMFFGGIVVSWIASVAATGVVYATARLDLPPTPAWHAAVLTLVFPFAFFFGVVYSESLFLLGLSAAVFGLRTRRWWIGAAAGAVMTATRVNGVMAVPALVWLAWEAATPTRDGRRRAIAAGLATSLGVTAYSFYNWRVAGDPFEWYHAITRWGYYPGATVAGNPLATLVTNLVTRPYAYLTTEPAAPYDVLNGLFPVVMAVCLPWLWRRLGAGYALLIAANLALPLSSGQFEGLGRYSAVLFPFQIWVASAATPAARVVIYGAYGVLYVVALALFTTLHPIF